MTEGWPTLPIGMLSGHTAGVGALARSPNGGLLASGARQATLEDLSRWPEKMRSE